MWAGCIDGVCAHDTPSMQVGAYAFQFLYNGSFSGGDLPLFFVLVSQNRQAAKDRFHIDLDYQVNVKAEMEMSVMASQIREM